MTPSLESVLLLLGRLEGKVDALLTAQGVYEQKLGFLENRLNRLEKAQAYFAGAVALGSLLMGWCMKGGWS